MKVGIVTIVDYANFGNRLQNYAVYYYLKDKFGCKAETLVSYNEKPFFNGQYVNWLKEHVVMNLCHFSQKAENHYGANFTRAFNFQQWSKLIPTKKYFNCNILPQKLNDRYDFFVVGSDQVWNYHFASKNFDNYFLKFAEQKKKISLSGSFGVNDIPYEWRSIYIDGLSSFSHISVREEAGQAIIKDLIGKDVPVLLDPVMMLSKEEWLKVAKKPRVDTSKPYILKYYLGNKMGDEIDAWAKSNGYEVYELLDDKIPELYSAGPGEFISLIRNASLVCSDSFHCIAFSILFSKPFIVFSRQGKGNNMVSRLNTLVNTFGFSDRWNYNLNEKEYFTCDFSSVPSVLEMERDRTYSFLKNALEL